MTQRVTKNWATLSFQNITTIFQKLPNWQKIAQLAKGSPHLVTLARAEKRGAPFGTLLKGQVTDYWGEVVGNDKHPCLLRYSN